MATYYSIDVMLQFPAMPEPRRVEVSVRDLYLLDRHTHRYIRTDGMVVYRLPERRRPWTWPKSAYAAV